MITRAVSLILAGAALLGAQVAVHGEKVHTVSGPPIDNGVVLVVDGRIAAIGRMGEVRIPEGWEVLKARVVTPGLVDARSTAGLAGVYNRDQDQDQLDRSAPIQPHLRALDAYNHRELLVDWLRQHGITTLNTGHAPAALMPGQTFITKTSGAPTGRNVLRETSAVLATLGDAARARGGKPGTTAKQMAMLRQHLLKARAYLEKRSAGASPGKGEVERKDAAPAAPLDLELEATAAVLRRDVPLIVSCHQERDIRNALRLRREFDLDLILCGASEAHLMLDEIAEAGVPVIVHPPMARTSGERKNATFELAARLHAAGIPFCFQSGYESYVPKSRVVLYEAAIAAAHGLGPDAALEALTLGAARILGVSSRVGSLDVGKDGDLALFDGDPFEYTTRCVGVVIDGRVVSRTPR